MNDLGIFLNGTVLCRSCNTLCATCNGPNVTDCTTCALVIGRNGLCTDQCEDNGKMLSTYIWMMDGTNFTVG